MPSQRTNPTMACPTRSRGLGCRSAGATGCASWSASFLRATRRAEICRLVSPGVPVRDHPREHLGAHPGAAGLRHVPLEFGDRRRQNVISQDGKLLAQLNDEIVTNLFVSSGTGP